MMVGCLSATFLARASGTASPVGKISKVSVSSAERSAMTASSPVGRRWRCGRGGCGLLGGWLFRASASTADERERKKCYEY